MKVGSVKGDEYYFSCFVINGPCLVVATSYDTYQAEHGEAVYLAVQVMIKGHYRYQYTQSGHASLYKQCAI